MSSVGGRPRWRVLVTPRWLAWHAFAVVAFIGMLWLGDWQFHRALSGNGLSWAYTFEWPLFAIMGAIFWGKTVRDELWPRPDTGDPRDRARTALQRARPAGRTTRPRTLSWPPITPTWRAFMSRSAAMAGGTGYANSWHRPAGRRAARHASRGVSGR